VFFIAYIIVLIRVIIRRAKGIPPGKSYDEDFDYSQAENEDEENKTDETLS